MKTCFVESAKNRFDAVQSRLRPKDVAAISEHRLRASHSPADQKSPRISPRRARVARLTAHSSAKISAAAQRPPPIWTSLHTAKAARPSSSHGSGTVLDLVGDRAAHRAPASTTRGADDGAPGEHRRFSASPRRHQQCPGNEDPEKVLNQAVEDSKDLVTIRRAMLRSGDARGALAASRRVETPSTRLCLFSDFEAPRRQQRQKDQADQLADEWYRRAQLAWRRVTTN